MSEDWTFAPEGAAYGGGDGRAGRIPDALELIERRVARIEHALAMHLPVAVDMPSAPPSDDGGGERFVLQSQLAAIADRLEGVVVALDGDFRRHQAVADAGERQSAQLAEIRELLVQASGRLEAGLRLGDILAAKLDYTRSSLPVPLLKRLARACLRRWPDAAFRVKEALNTRRERRLAKLIRASGYFDDAFYAAQNAAAGGEAIAPGGDLALHFVRHGHALGLSPGRRFDTGAYLRNHPDVVASGENALAHYLLRGRFQGRVAEPVAPGRWGNGNGAPGGAAAVDWSAVVAATTDIAAAVRAIDIPRHDAPLVSIVIPCLDKVEFTLNCLLSISRHRPKVAFEVIVADDGSAADQVEPLTRIRNVRLLRNETNLGFLRNCNAAAAEARGRYICFLNNDVAVHAGWLDALVATFEGADDRVGVVGSKLLFPDGSLQEAGGIVWSDGSGWNHGRGGDADAPEFNYLREVDYCSGASLMVARALWDEIGGFDDRFAPAYYEDTDLAFAARRAGYKVLYCPTSVVTHYEGISSGTDTGAGVKRHQALNHPKFREKWRRELARQPAPGSSPFLARDRAKAGSVVLFIDHHVPKFDTNAGDLAAWEYMRQLRAMGFVVKFFPHNGYLLPGYTEQLQAAGIEVIGGEEPGSLFDRWIRAHGREVGCFWIARPYVAADFLDRIRAHSDARIAYFTVDLHFARQAQELGIDWSRPFENPELAATMRQEISVMNAADVVLSASEDETRIIRSLLPGADVRTIPIRLFDDADLAAPVVPFEARRGLLFLGGFAHPPNTDAMRWFVTDILPRVREKRPEITLTIAGSEAPPEILRLNDVEGVRVLGHVEDLAPVYAAARYFVCPLRQGAGMKGKIVTSLGFGLPVITTAVGNQGLAMDETIGVPVCDTADAFVEAILDLYDDGDAWERYSERSRALAERQFSRRRAAEVLSHAVGLAERVCRVCGARPAIIPDRRQGNLREAVVCDACGAIHRNVRLADVLLAELGLGERAGLAQAADVLAGLDVLEIGGGGAIRGILSRLPRYIGTGYGPPGAVPAEFRLETVERLSFADGSFDIVLSEDVFEHVADPWRGFAEIMRVLKPGGRHVFSIPFHRHSAQSVKRAEDRDDRTIHFRPAEYHFDPFNPDGTLVYTDFGRDIVERLNGMGFETKVIATHDSRHAGSHNEVFVARKPSGAGRRARPGANAA